MTSREFIEKALRDTTKKTWCSSVTSHKDLGGGITVYSYGWHYPLVKIINGYAFVNDKGYSNTTAKHINWAFSAASNIVGWHNVFHAPLFDGGSLNKRDIIAGAEKELARLRAEMAGKKRQDTRVFDWLKAQEARMMGTIQITKELA